MPQISNVEDARKVRDGLLAFGKPVHDLLQEVRAVRDRSMPNLESFASILPAKYAEHWQPFQTEEPDMEVQDIVQLLCANEPTLEVVVRGQASAKVKEDAQTLELALEAVLAENTGIAFRQQRYDAMLADNFAVVVTDWLGPGEEIGAYADREALEKQAEESADDEDDDDDTPAGRYRRAYRANGRDHEKAYDAVAKEAQARDGLRVRRRVVDLATCYVHAAYTQGRPVVTSYMETYQASVGPLVRDLEGYGLVVEKDKIVVKDGGKRYPLGEHIGAEREPEGGVYVSGSAQFTGDKVTYTQIRTPETFCVLIEGAGKDDVVFIRQPAPVPGNTGVRIVAAFTRARAKTVERYRPYMHGMLVAAQEFNVVMSVAKTLAMAEAARREYVKGDDASVVPLDGTQEPKGVEEDEVLPLAGEIRRIEGTGLDVGALTRMLDERMERYRSREFFSGSGFAGESARHLARVQTAQQTKLTPIQTSCSEDDKAHIEEDVLGYVRATGQSVFVDEHMDLDKAHRGAAIRESRQYEITPKLARLPVRVLVSTGAEMPEARWARIQVSGEQMDRGTYGITTHRIESGVKDPGAEEALLIEDRLVAQNMDHALAYYDSLVKAAIEARVRALFPELEPAPQNVEPPPDATLSEGGGGGGIAPSLTNLIDAPVSMQPAEGLVDTVPDVAGVEGQRV